MKTEPETYMHIAEVERDTGIGKDTLRVWERRYRFPQPVRNADGERMYPFDQIERLRIIRRLLDKGMRPGNVISLDLSALHQLLQTHGGQEDDPARYAFCSGLVKLIRMHRGQELRDSLNRILVKEGIQNFITRTVVPMNNIVGNAWLRGDLTVPEEHLYTEQVQNVIRHAIQLQTAGTEPPRILLSTFPDEEHSLGLLMVEAMCTAEGAQCISLGPRIPLADIARYAQEAGFDVVAVSFSAAYPSRDAVKDLTHFRALLPDHLELWVGGAGISASQRRIQLPRVQIHTDIASVPDLVTQWREHHTQGEPT